MQKIFRLVSAAFFLLFVGYMYFKSHPVYLNLQAIGQAKSWSGKDLCPQAGALLCTDGITWQLLILGVVVVLGVSLYRWIYKGNPLVQWSLRPIAMFLYSQAFLLLVLSLYFFQSDFTKKYVSTWGASMMSFMSMWGSICFYLLLFVTVSAFLGYRLLQLFQTSFRERAVRIAIAIGLGISVFIFIFAILGQVGWFSLGPVIIFAVAAFAFSYPVWKKVLNDLFWEPVQLSFAYNQVSWFFVLILGLVLTMNIVDVMRPFPIGWDDLGVYMNFPRQIAGHGSLLAGYAGQAYMLITALGFTLAHSTTLAMFFSWLGGALAIYALYAFGKQFISSEAGLLMAAIMYSLPMVMHQSFADMKTDMGLFFFIIIAFLCLFLAMQEQANKARFWRLLVLSGIFLGTALAIKITTAIALFPLLAVLAWRFSGIWSGIAAFALLNSVYFYKFVTAPDISPTLKLNIASASLVIGLLALVWGIFSREKVVYFFRSILVLVGAIAITFSPWLLKNVLETNSLSLANMMWGGAAPSPTINWQAINVDSQACFYTATSEELGRYISQDTGFARYASLPWDMTMNVNQGGFYVDISFLLLAFSAVGIMFFPGWWSLVLLGVSGILVPLVVFLEAFRMEPLAILTYMSGGIVSPVIAPYLSYTPLVLFVGLLAGILYYKNGELEERKLWQNVVLLFVLCWYFWLFVASGIPWYGVAGFLFALLLVWRSWQVSLTIHPVLRGLMTALIVVSLLSTTLLRETRFVSQNLLAYAFGLRTEEQALANTNPLYPTIIKILNKDLSHPVYRVGTFINYFVDDNRTRVFDDAQLDAFKCIDGDGTDNARTLERLKTLNFRYLVYDTNTDTIEKDKNGTLHQKTKRFMEFARSSLTAVVPADINNAKNGIILFEIK